MLFQRDLRGYGSSMAWGMAYGIFWWFLGPLTVLPLCLGKPLDWSYIHASADFGPLIGNIITGLIIGLFYSVVDRLCVRFLTESDPIHREPEGPGLRFIRIVQWGGWPVSREGCCSSWYSLLLDRSMRSPLLSEELRRR